MAVDFETYQLGLHPPWLQGPYGEVWATAHGAMKDALCEAAREAIKARFVAVAPTDALPYHASERVLEQFPAEDGNAFRARLVAAWEAWQWAGTKKGVIDALTLIPLETVDLFEFLDWPDGAPEDWGRFWVVIDQPHGWFADGPWSDPGVYDDGGTWGSTMTPDEAFRIRRLVNTWRAAHSHCVWIIVLLSGELWDHPAGTWADPGSWENDGYALYISPR